VRNDVLPRITVTVLAVRQTIRALSCFVLVLIASRLYTVFIRDNVDSLLRACLPILEIQQTLISGDMIIPVRQLRKISVYDLISSLIST
jgi:hypothetical protein